MSDTNSPDTYEPLIGIEISAPQPLTSDNLAAIEEFRHAETKGLLAAFSSNPEDTHLMDERVKHSGEISFFNKTIELMPEKPEGFCVLAWESGKVVGFELFWIESQIRADGSVDATPLLGVGWEYKRQGIGQQLLERSFAKLRELGIKQYTCTTKPEVVALYKKLGAGVKPVEGKEGTYIVTVPEE